MIGMLPGIKRYKRGSFGSWSAPLRFAVLVLSLAVSSLAVTRGPDNGGYTATNAAVYSFIDLAGGTAGTSVLAGIDDGTAPIALPFAFQFYGNTYNNLCISSNGAAYFVASAPNCGAVPDFANTDLSIAPPPNDPPALLPFWTDLTFQVPGAGSVLYQTFGASGSRRFVIEWSNAYPQGSSSPVTFEIVLYEGTNQILFQYQSVDLGGGDANSNGGHATIGIRDAGALTSGNQIAWSYDAPVVGSSTAVQFSPRMSCATVASSITISGTGYTYNFGTQRFVQTVKLTNTGKTATSGPVAYVLDSLSGNARLYQPAGTTACTAPLGSPYVVTPGAIAPGSSASVTLQYTNPTKAVITYKPRVLTGPGKF